MFLLLSIFINFCFIISTEAGSKEIPPPESQNCPRFEEWNYCGPPSPECGLHCKQEEPPNPTACTKNCVAGCVCKPGYIRDLRTGKCVDDRYCPAPGDKHVVFSPCKANYQINCFENEPYSADSSSEDSSTGHNGCSCPCIPGYVCKKGFAKDYTGFCVPRDVCGDTAPA